MLNNIYWITPEIFIVIVINIQIILGIIYEKLNKWQKLKTLWITIISLIITSIMYLDNIDMNINLYVSVELLRIDNLTNIIKSIICISTGIILIMSEEIIKRLNMKEIEYSIIVNIATLGLLMIISANELIILYLGIEIYSLSFYVLTAINKWSEKSTEAGLKYYVLGSLASGIYLFGASIIYMITGEIKINGIEEYIKIGNEDKVLMIGIIFIMVALLFKIAAGPFHMWAPDVYDGAPLIITSYFAIVPKLALLTIIYRLVYYPFYYLIDSIIPLLLFSAIVSMIIGSIAGLNQSRIKRLMAYSSIAHVGFILMALSTNTIIGIQTAIIYTIIYIITSICIFTSIIIIYDKTDYITELAGYGRRNGVVAMGLSLGLYSAAGIPPLAGFFAKWLVIYEALNNDLYFLALIAVITSTIALVYYIRITKWLYFKDSEDYNMKIMLDTIKSNENISVALTLILGFSLFLILTILIYPMLLIKFANYLLILSLV